MGNLLKRRQNSESNQDKKTTNINSLLHRSLDNKIQQNSDICHFYIRLREEVTNKEVKLLSENINFAKMAENQTWSLNFIDQSNNYPYIISLIQQCQGVKTIKIISKPQSDFYIHLQYPKFIGLNKIVLSNCLLVSCQFLASISMPDLKELCLSDNLLTTVKSLKKIVCQLQNLNLRRNKLINLCDDNIHEISFNQDVQTLNFQQSGKEYYGDDLMWYMKMPIKSLRRLEINGQNRIPIRNSKFDKMTQRYRGMQCQMFCWGPKTYSQYTFHNGPYF